MDRTLPPAIKPANLSGWAPGVYRQDIFPAPEPVFQTGVPVFLGYAEQGPIGEPKLLSLWPQFQDLYGAPMPTGYLAHAVRGFFENDGLFCYVMRLEDRAQPLNDLRVGLDRIRALDGIDLVCVPDAARPASDGTRPSIDAVATLQQEVLDHCRLLGDRFAILDGVYAAEAAAIEAQRGQLHGDYGAFYVPWVAIDGKPTYVPPCGHVAGIYSRTDQRVGVHKAPANEVVEGVYDLRIALTDGEHGRLNERGVNCLRAFPGRGIRVWGARTLSDDPAWTYINARRLFVTVGRRLERLMQDVTFAPNDIRLWVRIMRELTAYFDDLFRQGALKGRTAEEAFFVKCDGETNTPEVRDAGMVVTEIGLAPATPGEFIVVRVIHGPSGVTITPAV